MLESLAPGITRALHAMAVFISVLFTQGEEKDNGAKTTKLCFFLFAWGRHYIEVIVPQLQRTVGMAGSKKQYQYHTNLSPRRLVTFESSDYRLLRWKSRTTTLFAIKKMLLNCQCEVSKIRLTFSNCLFKSRTSYRFSYMIQTSFRCVMNP